jgi:uncharacterized membrane protein required for colicin V production
MTLTDVFLILLAAAGAIYGIIRGIRPSLYLLVTFLGALLAVILFTVPLERLVLDLTGVGSENYPGAPAVAVLILEGQTGNAYLAAFIPSILALFLLLALGIGGVLLGQFIRNASRNTLSRVFGALCGLLAGSVAALLVAVQLSRMPWPAAGEMFRGSILISALNHVVDWLIPALVGGI